MGLADAVQGARHIAQQIGWQDELGGAIDLSGATITGYRRNVATRIDTVLDGDLDVVSPGSAGSFTWTYGSIDVLEYGEFDVQFIATYADLSKEKSLFARWVVHEAMDV